MKRMLQIALTAGLTLLVSASMTYAGGKKLKVGGKAPQFSGKTADGTVFDSKDHVGKKTIAVFFFPAAFTGG